MRGLLKLTHILCPLFIGFIIGGAILQNTAFLISGIILLVLDILIGILLQNIVDRSSEATNDEFTREQQRALEEYMIQRLLQEAKAEEQSNAAAREGSTTKNNPLCKEFRDAYAHLKFRGGNKTLTFKGMGNDVVGALLLDVCKQIPHAPLLHTLYGLYEVLIEDWNSIPAIGYKFLYNTGSICQNVYIYLVLTREEKIRLFAIETDYNKFVLCEYSGNSHLNYGPVELQEVSSRITEIVDA